MGGIVGLDHGQQVLVPGLLEDDVVAVAIDGVPFPDGYLPPRARLFSFRFAGVRSAINLQPADDAPAVQMFVVKAQVALLAKPIDGLLNVFGR